MSIRFRHLSIVVHRSKVWLSELAVIAIMAAVLVTLVSLAAVVLANEARIRKNNAAISTLKGAGPASERLLHDLRERELIASTLREFLGGRLPERTLLLLTDLVHSNSRRFGYDPFLVMAVIHVESVFDADALGRKRDGEHSGALGLMQLKFATAQEVAADLGIPLLRPDDLFVPELNIALGMAYLTRLIARFQSLKLGILAYNLGPTTVRRSLAGDEELPMRYYNRVLRSYFKLKQVGESQRNPQEPG